MNTDFIDLEWRTDMRKQQSLLGVFAHPDDESFGPGGTLARYAAEGRAVHVIIATDGIAGSVEDATKVASHETLAQVRSKELSDAAVALAITSIWSLPYRDSGMRNTPANDHPDALVQQPVATLTHEMVDYIERLQPDVIVTHDPFGGYGHPDHIRVCEMVTAAFHLARGNAKKGDHYVGPQKLYYTAFDKRILKLAVRLMPFFRQNPSAIGRNRDIDLVEISRWETPVHAMVNVEPYLDRKSAASIAHATQYSGGPAFVRILPSVFRRNFLANESFTRAYPAPNGRLERDLFTGVR